MKVITKVLFAIYGLFISMTTSLAAYPTRNTLPTINTNTGLDEFWDFLNGADGTAFNEVTTGAATAGVAFTGSTPYYPGAERIGVHTVGDYSAFITNGVIGFGTVSASLNFQTRAKILTLSNGSDAFKLKFGFSTTLDFISPPVFESTFIYDSSLSSNWICFTRSSAAGVSDTFATTVPVTTDDTYYKIYITPQIIYYYINNVLAHTYALDSTLVTGGVKFGAAAQKTLGNAAVLRTDFDAVKLQQTFITPRAFE